MKVVLFLIYNRGNVHFYEFQAKESIFNADQLSKFLTDQYRLLSVDLKD